MSVQATTWVWEHSQAEGNARLVLLAIADAANREGEKSCQSVPSLADMCKLGEATIYRKINELVALGELEKDGRSKRYGTTIYSLPKMKRPSQNETPYPSQNERSQNETPINTTEAPYQNEPVALSPLIDNPINPSITNVIHPSSDAPSAQPTHNRGTRITEDFWPAQKHIDKIKAMKPGLDLDLEHTKFMNYWLSVTGRNATKKDWGRTWENWMLNAKAGNDYKPGWQKRLEYNAQMNQQYQSDPGADFLRSIDQ
ncbi:helix-turn-helix domain-containing protein [Rothia nasimurium]|uniref:helix-turn-helix domain-containing protein n=1 Tax=Rothia nasimurium TaxID=85336 RepID=UPI001F3D90D0|nr:helix-turn-helix domain-containing protein [Rothia nasimurium]